MKFVSKLPFHSLLKEGIPEYQHLLLQKNVYITIKHIYVWVNFFYSRERLLQLINHIAYVCMLIYQFEYVYLVILRYSKSYCVEIFQESL
jgi:hypothetical protein